MGRHQSLSSDMGQERAEEEYQITTSISLVSHKIKATPSSPAYYDHGGVIKGEAEQSVAHLSVAHQSVAHLCVAQ